MLRQLARLTRSVRAANGAVAIAVYADAADRPLAATDRGHEGVACVDDAARALILMCDLWKATGSAVIEAWARGLLEFVLYMQDRDGRCVNFIADWSGRRNEDGPTSFAGGSFWQARAIRGLARASATFEDARAARAALLAMEQVRGLPAPADVRALHVLAAVDLLRRGAAPDLQADLEAWTAELVACRHGGVLFDNPDQLEPHLWAHVQEAALVEAGSYLGRDDLTRVARESVQRYLAPIITSAFDLPTVQPYGVACALFGVERLAAVTGEPGLRHLVEQARAWFDERNPAGRPVYDRARGRVGDGIDGGVVSDHSGAESNIAGAQTLFPELPRIVGAHGALLERELRPLLGRAVAV